MKLPNIPYPKAMQKTVQVQFGGLDRRLAAGNGAICDMTNLWGGDAPLLSSRPKRQTADAALTSPRGLFRCGETLFWCDGEALYANGEAVSWAEELPGTPHPAGESGEALLSDTDKFFAALGERVLIWPDKVMVRRVDDPSSALRAPSPQGEGIDVEDGAEDPSLGEETEEVGAWEIVPLEASVTVSATFEDGTYAGEPAMANTIKVAVSAEDWPDGFDWADYFSVGDAVTISGAADEENNQTIIVREIDGNELRFYENSFTVSAAAAEITVAREVPELDFLCVNENRVWGCKGDEVRCCKLGDPFNWNVFDGISTDAWSWETGTAGDFTAAITFMGYPCFFKEDRIFKVYGNRPTNFETMSAPTLGVLAGAHKSLAVARETLFYLSRAGFCAYSGGIPSPIGEELHRSYAGAVAGTDGLKYWVSAERNPQSAEPTAPLAGEPNKEVELLCYDPAMRIWHREDDLSAFEMGCWGGGVICLTEDGSLLWWGGAQGTERPAAGGGLVWTEEETVSWSVEFADFTMDSPDKKGVSKLQLRLALDEESTAEVEIQYDSDGVWRDTASLRATVKRSWYLPVIPRRCDHFRLRLRGTGRCVLHSLAVESYAGSALQRH